MTKGFKTTPTDTVYGFPRNDYTDIDLVNSGDLTDTLKVSADNLEDISAGFEEGEYSAWTLVQDISSPIDDGFIQTGSKFNRDETKAVIISSSGNIFVIDIPSRTIADSGVTSEVPYTLFASSSLYGKYLGCAQKLTKTLVYIFKDGTLVQTLDTSGFPAASTEGVLFSPTGRYVLIGHEYYYPAYNSGYALYEGS